MPFPNILLSPAAPPILHWVLGVVPSCMPSQNPPLYAEAYIFTAESFHPWSPHQQLPSNALWQPHDAFPPLLSHQPSCIVAGLRYRSFHISEPSLLPRLSTPLPFAPFRSELFCSSHKPFFSIPAMRDCYSPHRSSIIPASPATSAWSSASAGTHAASPSTVDL